MVELNPIFNDFKNFFISPIFDIDPYSDSKDTLRKNILEDILNNKLDEAIQILKNGISNLLNLKFKKDLKEYLYSICPEDNHFPIFAFTRNLHHISQYIIRNKGDLTSEFINSLNDLSLEYYANHYNFYTLKIYQKKGSLKELIENTTYILEKYTGKIGGGIGAKRGGLGVEYHDIHTLEPSIKNEVTIVIYFNLNDPEYHPHNNIYIYFWGIGKGRKLWDDVSEASINKISQFLGEFLDEPNLQIINLNQSIYVVKSALPEKIVEVIESSQSTDVSLKFDRIVDINYHFEEDAYNEIRSEINGTYRKKYFTSMYILIRKLLENLMIDCLRNYYKGRNIEKYFDENNKRFLVFEKLKKNFNSMKDEADFIQKVGTVEQYFIDVLDKFKETGNIHGHSLFSIPHHNIVEDNRDILNILIKRLSEIKKILF